MTPVRVWFTVAAWLVLWLALWASDANPSVPVLGGVVAVVSALSFATLDLGRSIRGVKWPQPPVLSQSQRHGDPRVSNMVRDAYAAVWTDSVEIHNTLVELVDDRLSANHSVNRSESPERAAALLSPTLRQLVAGPRRRTAGVRELQKILSDIEAL